MSIFFKKIENNFEEINNCTENIFKKFINIKNNSIVFIKPNFSGRPPILKGENTSIELLEAIIRVLSKKECKILIGHYSLLAMDKNIFTFEQMIDAGGYNVLLRYKNVRFIDLDKEESKDLKIKNINTKTPKILDDVDYFINVAKAKTHMETDVSLSIKNLMGMIDDFGRKMFHKIGLNELIGYLGVYFKPDLNIIDGLVSMEGNGPHEGENKETNFIAAGDNLVELDSFIASIMGFDFRNIIHIKKAQELKVGNYVDKIILDKYRDIIKLYKFNKADEYMRFGKKIYFWPTTSCSLCHEVMRDFKKKLKKNIFLGIKFYFYAFFYKRRINIITGQCNKMKYFKNDKNICIGSCTANFANNNNINNLSGCPPNVEDVIKFVFKK